MKNSAVAVVTTFLMSLCTYAWILLCEYYASFHALFCTQNPMHKVCSSFDFFLLDGPPFVMQAEKSSTVDTQSSVWGKDIHVKQKVKFRKSVVANGPYLFDEDVIAVM
jgi:hypothetical protein